MKGEVSSVKLGKMKVEILATESLGVRSMACMVTAGRWRILIDPGAALGPRRYGLPPHREEIHVLWKRWFEIKRALKSADLVVITHYHYDHFNPQEPELFRDKVLFVKDPERRINSSQRRRASAFLPGLRDIAKVEIADGRVFQFGEMLLRFSEPVPHGETVKRGYVIQVLIEHGGFRFLHTSDVGGYPLEEQNEFALFWAPDLIFMDGPSTYMAGDRVLVGAKKHMAELLRSGRLKKLVVDHHLLRDRNWRSRVRDIVEEAKRMGADVLTAAEFMGVKVMPLEAKRRELYFG